MNIKRLLAISAVIVFALVISACSKYASQNTNSSTTQQQSTSSSVAAAVTITFSDQGVTPAQVTVKSGETVQWVNNSSKAVSVASDPHPIHTANLELTNGQFVAQLAPGASVTLTLTKKGTWGFHDHLSPSVKGKVTVE